MTTPKFHKLSWSQLEKDTISLFPKIKDLGIDRIVSIAQGGTIVARIIDDLLGFIPTSHITISSYQDLKKLDAPIITEHPALDIADQTILLVDEISDTGATFQIAKEFLQRKQPKKIYTLAPYIKPHTQFEPDFFAHSVNEWVVFPYEIHETFAGMKKMFETQEAALSKMREIGFEDWELAFLRH